MYQTRVGGLRPEQHADPAPAPRPVRDGHGSGGRPAGCPDPTVGPGSRQPTPPARPRRPIAERRPPTRDRHGPGSGAPGEEHPDHPTGEDRRGGPRLYPRAGPQPAPPTALWVRRVPRANDPIRLRRPHGPRQSFLAPRPRWVIDDTSRVVATTSVEPVVVLGVGVGPPLTRRPVRVKSADPEPTQQPSAWGPTGP